MFRILYLTLKIFTQNLTWNLLTFWCSNMTWISMWGNTTFYFLQIITGWQDFIIVLNQWQGNQTNLSIQCTLIWQTEHSKSSLGGAKTDSELMLTMYSLQCRHILSVWPHIFVLSRHLGFGNCGGLEEEKICQGSRCEVASIKLQSKMATS